jgi:hypothetical protein
MRKFFWDFVEIVFFGYIIGSKKEKALISFIELDVLDIGMHRCF